MARAAAQELADTFISTDAKRAARAGSPTRRRRGCVVALEPPRPRGLERVLT
jgi:hypothetical protein